MRGGFLTRFAAALLLAMAACRSEEDAMPMMMQAADRPPIDAAAPAVTGTISFAVG